MQAIVQTRGILDYYITPNILKDLSQKPVAASPAGPLSTALRKLIIVCSICPELIRRKARFNYFCLKFRRTGRWALI